MTQDGTTTLQQRLDEQNEKISQLEKAANKAKAITAIVSLSSAAIGVAVSLGLGLIYLSNELNTWSKLKAIHSGGDAVNAAVDHSQIMTIVREELSSRPKFGEAISIKSSQGFLTSNNGGRDELDVLISGRPSPWSIEK